MARRRRRHSRGMKIPIVSLAILGGQVAIAWQRGGGNALRTMQEIGVMYTGFDSNAGGWNVPRLVEGYGPWLVKWGIGKFGLLRSANAGIARMHVPVSLS